MWKTTVGTLNGGDVWTAQAMDDVNGDGNADVIAGSFDTNVYALDGDSGAVLWSFNTGNRAFSVYPVGDLNGDGRPEVAAATQDTTNSVVLHVIEGDSGLPDPPATYCAGKTNSLGCVPFITTSGFPSETTGTFLITGNDMMPSQSGLLLYSFQKSSLGFHGGTLCVKSPFKRVLPIKAAVDTGPLPCTGVLKRDFNNTIAAGNDPMLTSGQKVFAQWRQRDPADPAGFGDGLTNGVTFTIAP